MSIDSLVWLFIGAFVSWVVLGLVYGFHIEASKPEPPVIRVRIRVQHRHFSRMPLDMSPDDFYQGCYQSLINALEKEAKDNL